MDLESDINKLIKSKITRVRLFEACRRLSFTIDYKNWKPTMEALYYENLLSFTLMKIITFSHLEEGAGIKISIELHSRLRGESINVSTIVDKNQKIPSLTSLWTYADWFECEINHRAGKIIEGIKSKNPYEGKRREHSH